MAELREMLGLGLRTKGSLHIPQQRVVICNFIRFCCNIMYLADVYYLFLLVRADLDYISHFYTKYQIFILFWILLSLPLYYGCHYHTLLVSALFAKRLMCFLNLSDNMFLSRRSPGSPKWMLLHNYLDIM